MFLTNDFGLINIEKTAIVTALAIDKGNESDYSIAVQVAVPEAGNTNTENPKAVIKGQGDTVASALKNAGSSCGWYLKLSFCNLLIIGESLTGESVIKELDFFAKTLNIQDSSLVITTKDAGKLLEVASPLDNISSFALQKILLKEPGFDSEVRATDLREFVQGAYSKSHSSFMPKVDIMQLEDSSSGGSGGSGSGTNSSSSGGASGDKKVYFDATTTALFVSGVKVGELDKNLTYIFKALKSGGSSSTFSVSVGETNYLLNAIRTTPKIKITANEYSCAVDIDLELYCKIVDQNAEWQDTENSRNVPLPDELIKNAEVKLEKDINEFIGVIKNTGCDLLGVLDSVYKYHYPYYHYLKDDCAKNLTAKVSVSVKGQR